MSSNAPHLSNQGDTLRDRFDVLDVDGLRHLASWNQAATRVECTRISELGRVQGDAEMNSPHDGELGVIKGDVRKAANLRDLSRGVGNHTRWRSFSTPVSWRVPRTCRRQPKQLVQEGRARAARGATRTTPTLRTVGQRARHDIQVSRAA